MRRWPFDHRDFFVVRLQHVPALTLPRSRRNLRSFSSTRLEKDRSIERSRSQEAVSARHPSGKAATGARRAAGHPGGACGVHRVGHLVELLGQQMSVQVQRHGRRRVAEHRLHDLDVGAAGDRQRGGRRAAGRAGSGRPGPRRGRRGQSSCGRKLRRWRTPPFSAAEANSDGALPTTLCAGARDTDRDPCRPTHASDGTASPRCASIQAWRSSRR
jgi:hypothetical protein